MDEQVDDHVGRWRMYRIMAMEEKFESAWAVLGRTEIDGVTFDFSPLRNVYWPFGKCYFESVGHVFRMPPSLTPLAFLCRDPNAEDDEPDPDDLEDEEDEPGPWPDRREPLLDDGSFLFPWQTDFPPSDEDVARLIRVQPGDTLVAIWCGEGRYPAMPFAYLADVQFGKLRFELHRAGEALVCGLRIHRINFRGKMASRHFIFETMAERIFENVRPEYKKALQRDYGTGLTPLSEWDDIAEMLISAVQSSNRDSRKLGLMDQSLHLASFGHLLVDQDDQQKPSAYAWKMYINSVLGAGAELGYFLRIAEEGDFMRGEAYKHVRRRRTSSDGGSKRAQILKANAETWKRHAQSRAEAIWLKNPDLSRQAVANILARMLGRPTNTIRQALKKPSPKKS